MVQLGKFSNHPSHGDFTLGTVGTSGQQANPSGYDSQFAMENHHFYW
jgi:hypothetical protein